MVNLGISWVISHHFRQKLDISGYLGLSWAILGYLSLSQAIISNIRLPRAILGYLKLSRALSGYDELSRLSLAISGYYWQLLAISGCIWSHIFVGTCLRISSWMCFIDSSCDFRFWLQLSHCVYALIYCWDCVTNLTLRILWTIQKTNHHHHTPQTE